MPAQADIQAVAAETSCSPAANDAARLWNYPEAARQNAALIFTRSVKLSNAVLPFPPTFTRTCTIPPEI
jgi:hypothetical protein